MLQPLRGPKTQVSLTCLRPPSGDQTIDFPSQISAATRELTGVHSDRASREDPRRGVANPSTELRELRGNARVSAVIPNERAISGLRPIPHRALLSVPPPRPRFVLLPRPHREDRGQCVGIPGDEPYPVLLRDLPMEWTVVAIAMGGGDRGGGFSSPQAGTRTFLLKAPAPLPGQGRCMGIPGKIRARGCKRPDGAKHDR